MEVVLVVEDDDVEVDVDDALTEDEDDCDDAWMDESERRSERIISRPPSGIREAALGGSENATEKSVEGEFRATRSTSWLNGSLESIRVAEKSRRYGKCSRAVPYKGAGSEVPKKDLDL